MHNHPMTTQSPNNSYKPKQAFTATKHPINSSIGPLCVPQSIKDPEWKAGTSKECDARYKWYMKTCPLST